MMEFEKVYDGNMVEVFRLSDRLFFRRANLAIRHQCNGAFIIGDSEVAIVDAPPESIEMAEEAEKIFKKPVTAVLLTHGHWDHVQGITEWLDRDVTIYCSRRVVETLDPSVRKHRANFAGIDGRVNLYLGGGVEIELFTNNDVAHSKWDMFIRIPELGVVCTGDSVVEHQTTYFHSADIRSWILSVQRLAAQPGNYILSGHGPTLFPYSYLTEFAEWLTVIEKAAQTILKRTWPKPNEDIDERFQALSIPAVIELVEQYFSEGSPEARYIESKVDKENSRRVVRMVLYEYIRLYLR
jgi:glyoxylase-like metal-dependent hydrolase (beta-lactamase superfamily II)